jgi:hypothetical protein
MNPIQASPEHTPYTNNIASDSSDLLVVVMIIFDKGVIIRQVI